MTAVGWLPAGVEDLFGTDASAEESYGLLTVDVPPTSWITALETARDRLGCTYFDWLSAVDEPGTGFRVAAHVAALGPVRRLLLRTTVPHDAPALPSAVGVYAGAAWHERETHEMFGVAFEDHPALDHLLLPEGFEGHPLRKDFVLAARVAKAWPGAKEPGESEHGGPRRRQMLPPGVPDPNEWGPLKGQLPPAPARPARGAGRAAGERPVRGAGERPARRTRTAAEGSVGQTAPGAETPAAPRRSRTAAEGSAAQTSPADEPTAPAPAPTSAPGPAPTPRRSRSASQGSASQRAAGPADGPTADTTAGQGDVTDTGAPATGRTPGTDVASDPQRERPGGTGRSAGTAGPRRSRSASQGSASQREAAPAGQPDDAGSGSAPEGGDDTTSSGASEGGDDTASSPAAEPAPKPVPSTPRSPDAPWHHARPAFDEPDAAGDPEAAGEPEAAGHAEAAGEPEAGEEPEASSESPEAESDTPGDTDAPGNPPNPPNPPGGRQ
ncbi:dehydrogenase [Streptomyces sp. CB09001]|uniref:NADH-quinone oxidoreductase subunit C n=1 Tax=Streptomyces sp. CB09001 TaxID=2083284 RepID=UPI000E215BD3|nr:NADH-quinone oxidoreductase subunit C [Streptomyces sp. CB09001]AXL90336.1 dehydrogenase [Streptomyces sp. CB09001]